MGLGNLLTRVALSAGGRAKSKFLLCDAELELFQAILGEDVVIERTEHILLGARRCAYRIRTAFAPRGKH